MGDPSFVKNQTWDRGTADNVSVSTLCLSSSSSSSLLPSSTHQNTHTRREREGQPVLLSIESTTAQYFPRQDNAACAPVADIMISYCDNEDFYCDNGTAANSLLIHEGYVQEYGDQAAQYVIDQIGGCTAAS